jgi:hypothetical protein
MTQLTQAVATTPLDQQLVAQSFDARIAELARLANQQDTTGDPWFAAQLRPLVARLQDCRDRLLAPDHPNVRGDDLGG